MGHSTSRDTLTKRLPILAELAAGKACQWEVTPPTPDASRKLAREIHEALYVASLYPKEYPALAEARRAFSIHIVRPGLVEARRRPARDLDPRATGLTTHGGGDQPAFKPVPLVGHTTAQGIMDAWDGHTPSLDPLHFQQTTLPGVELIRLYAWAQGHTPKLQILVGAGFITLSLVEAGMEGFAWHPPVPTPEPEPSYDV